MATFGENLRALRKSRGYTQERFARAINSNQANVTAWERETRMPNLETITMIAQTFKVPLSSLLPMEDTGMDEDYVREIADLLMSRPEIRRLIDKIRYMPAKDLDAILRVVDAMTKDA